MEFAGREERVVVAGRRGERIRASRGSSRRRMADRVQVGGSCVGMSAMQIVLAQCSESLRNRGSR